MTELEQAVEFLRENGYDIHRDIDGRWAWKDAVGLSQKQGQPPKFKYKTSHISDNAVFALAVGRGWTPKGEEA